MRIFLVLTALFIAALLTACQPTQVLNTVVPSGTYERQQGVPYGNHERQRMDIYVPTETPVRKNVIVFVYGGAWDQGSKEQFEFVGQAFARLGYITVLPNYRLYPDVEFPDFIHDVAMAVSETNRHLPQACGSEPQFILAGHSAGAHTAALLIADPDYLNNHGINLSQIHGFIGMSGPYDLPLDHERVAEKFTKVEGDEANPIALTHAGMPPALLLHGESDTVAAPFHTERFSAQLRQSGVPVTTHFYSGRRHADLLASLASPLRFWSGAYTDIQAFLQANELDSYCEPDK